MQPLNLYIDHPPQVPIYIASLPPDFYPTPYANALTQPDSVLTPFSYANISVSDATSCGRADTRALTVTRPPSLSQNSANTGIPDSGRASRGAPALGGLSCLSRSEFSVGHLVAICMPQVHASFIAITRVRWRRRYPDGYQLGLDFLDAGQAFQVRMLEQTFYIQIYRQYIAQAEGRHLSDEEAAQEWINRYGAVFPSSDNG